MSARVMEKDPKGDWQKTWDTRMAALESAFGKTADNVYHAVMPLALGGQADVVKIPGYAGGIAYVTTEMTGSEAGQIPNTLGEYELMICTREENQRAAELISRLASYTCETVLEAGETMDMPGFFADGNIAALLFCHPNAEPVRFTLNQKQCGVLLCVGISADELEFKMEHGAESLLEALKAGEVFPFTIPDRASVVPASSIQPVVPDGEQPASTPRLHLKRVGELVQSDSPASLVNATREFRRAVEARLLQFAELLNRLRTEWSDEPAADVPMPVPGAELQRVSYKVSYSSPKLPRPIQFSYTPVPERVFQIVERMESCLTGASPLALNDPAIGGELRSLLDEGSALLEACLSCALSGSFIEDEDGTINIGFDTDAYPDLLPLIESGDEVSIEIEPEDAPWRQDPDAG